MKYAKLSGIYGAFCLGALGLQAETVLQDNFERRGALRGSMPDIGSVAWVIPESVINPVLSEGRLICPGDRSNEKRLNLPFDFNPGRVYTLSVDVDVEDHIGTKWLACGFTSDCSGSESLGGGAIGPWMFIRSESLSGNSLRTGGGPGNYHAEGRDLSPFRNNGTLKIVLNACGDVYTADFFFDEESVGSFVFFEKPSIKGVFLSCSSAASGSFDNLKLDVSAQ